ncbi:UdgX family uracil-DNA binding protein [Acidisoma sp.]|uniref:UdgX family uracil-DNA binding protein n=1 Tax=Acidisoma sp. TaxID=1872115 RepID=UPI003AFF62B5
MNRVRLAHQTDFTGWRDAARQALLARVSPDMLDWRVEGEDAPDLFLAEGVEAAPVAPGAAVMQPSGPRVPRAFISLAETVILHRDPGRFALLYRLLWGMQRQPKLLEDASHPDVHLAEQVAKAIRRDIHKMHAFVRFREVETPDGAAHFIAWFEPDNFIVEAAAPFFVRRFTGMLWTILTPDRTASWDGEHLTFAAGARQEQAPTSDRLEVLWRAYYANIFNPARLKLAAMTREMPKRYWKNLPEAELIGPLTAQAAAREDAMVKASPTEPPLFAAVEARRRPDAPVPADTGERPQTLGEARTAAAACRRCPLWENATQTVFGEGPEGARLMLVGEQPGDREDLAGKPFVGPAGAMLDRALAEAGVPRAEVYVTNAVKHFKFEPRGKFRLHKTPETPEITACRWWLDTERALVRPRLTVALGASAAQALLGRRVTIGRERGRPEELPQGGALWITVHPSYLLRLPDEAAKTREYGKFVADLAGAWDWLGAAG